MRPAPVPACAPNWPVGNYAAPRRGNRRLRCGISVWLMSQMGQTRSFGDVASMSGLLPKVAVQRTTMDGRELPGADSCTAANDVLTNLLYQPPISGTFASVITFFHLAMSAFT